MKGIRRRMIISSFMALLLVSGLIWASPGVLAADRITFMLDWAPQGRFAPFYIAKAKGYYAENGIDVNIMRGYGGTKTAQSVDQGLAEFGIADMGTVVVIIAKGGKIKAVGIIHDLTPQGFDSLKTSGITKPKDMEGKKIAAAVDSATRAVMPAFYKQNKIDGSKVELVPLDGAVYIPALLRGDVDMIISWKGSNRQSLLHETKKKGLEVNRIDIGDYGLDIYGAAIITTEKMIKENPDLVRRFVKATYKGLRYGIEHPEEATDIIMKLHPELIRDIIHAQWQDAIDMSQTPTQKKMGYGYMTEEKVKRTRDIVLAGHEIKEEVPLSKLYTNEFLPGK